MTDAARVPHPPTTSRPYLDEDGLLRNAGAWTVIPDSQLVLVALLLERAHRVVRYPEVEAAYAAGGGTGHARAVRMMLPRLTRRLASVGLELVVVRARGVLLTWGRVPTPALT